MRLRRREFLVDLVFLELLQADDGLVGEGAGPLADLGQRRLELAEGGLDVALVFDGREIQGLRRVGGLRAGPRWPAASWSAAR